MSLRGHGQKLDASVGELDQAITVIRQLEVLRLGPVPLQRGQVGERAVVGRDDAQAFGLLGGNRDVHVSFLSAVSARRIPLSTTGSAIRTAHSIRRRSSSSSAGSGLICPDRRCSAAGPMTGSLPSTSRMQPSSRCRSRGRHFGMLGVRPSCTARSGRRASRRGTPPRNGPPRAPRRRSRRVRSPSTSSASCAALGQPATPRSARNTWSGHAGSTGPAPATQHRTALHRLRHLDPRGVQQRRRQVDQAHQLLHAAAPSKPGRPWRSARGSTTRDSALVFAVARLEVVAVVGGVQHHRIVAMPRLRSASSTRRTPRPAA